MGNEQRWECLDFLPRKSLEAGCTSLRQAHSPTCLTTAAPLAATAAPRAASAVAAAAPLSASASALRGAGFLEGVTRFLLPLLLALALLEDLLLPRKSLTPTAPAIATAAAMPTPTTTPLPPVDEAAAGALLLRRDIVAATAWRTPASSSAYSVSLIVIACAGDRCPTCALCMHHQDSTIGPWAELAGLVCSASVTGVRLANTRNARAAETVFPTQAVRAMRRAPLVALICILVLARCAKAGRLLPQGECCSNWTTCPAPAWMCSEPKSAIEVAVGPKRSPQGHAGWPMSLPPVLPAANHIRVVCCVLST